MLSEAQKQFMEIMFVHLAEQYYQMYKNNLLWQLYVEALKERAEQADNSLIILRGEM